MFYESRISLSLEPKMGPIIISWAESIFFEMKSLKNFKQSWSEISRSESIISCLVILKILVFCLYSIRFLLSWVVNYWNIEFLLVASNISNIFWTSKSNKGILPTAFKTSVRSRSKKSLISCSRSPVYLTIMAVSITFLPDVLEYTCL